jgi:hypothetical protein
MDLSKAEEKILDYWDSIDIIKLMSGTMLTERFKFVKLLDIIEVMRKQLRLIYFYLSILLENNI